MDLGLNLDLFYCSLFGNIGSWETGFIMGGLLGISLEDSMGGTRVGKT